MGRLPALHADDPPKCSDISCYVHCYILPCVYNQCHNQGDEHCKFRLHMMNLTLYLATSPIYKFRDPPSTKPSDPRPASTSAYTQTFFGSRQTPYIGRSHNSKSQQKELEQGIISGNKHPISQGIQLWGRLINCGHPLDELLNLITRWFIIFFRNYSPPTTTKFIID